jgi:hypothetical protein
MADAPAAKPLTTRAGHDSFDIANDWEGDLCRDVIAAHTAKPGLSRIGDDLKTTWRVSSTRNTVARISSQSV